MSGESVRSGAAAVPLAWWVRAADVLVIVLVILACSAALTDGFRVRLFDLRLSATSPWRLLVWAALLAAVRHWRVRQPSLVHRVTLGVRRACRDEALRATVPLAVASRLAVFFVGLYATLLFGFPQEPPPYRISRHEVVNLPARWDSGWYLSIAQGGYYWTPGARGQSNVAFFPAYPLAMRMVALPVGRTPVVFLWAGVVVSWIAFAWGLALVYRLAREHPALGTREHAETAVLLLASYPFAVFYGAPYTEGLFLLASASAFYAATHGRWGRVVAWGVLAGLTRPNGVFLAAALVPLVVSRWQATRTAHGGDRTLLAGGLGAALGPAYGLAAHSAYLYALTGNPLQWAAAQVAWERTFTGWNWIAEPVSYIARHGLLTYFRDAQPHSLDLAAALFALVVTIPIARRLGVAYAALVLVNVGLPLARGGELSMGRFTAVLFPLFMWLAAAVPARQRGVWVAAFAIGQGLMAVLFYTWRPPF